MDTRMAKHILARTSKVVDATDSTETAGYYGRAYGTGWHTNAAGYHFNQNYGFGLIDADAFTEMAARVSGITPVAKIDLSAEHLAKALPNQVFESDTQILFNNNAPLEEVELRLDITHPWRGEIEAYLQSPSGTVSRMMHYNALDSFENISSDWVFTTNEFWGEGSLGFWTVYVVDLGDAFGKEHLGTWNGYQLTLYTGDITLTPEPGTLALSGLAGFVGLFWYVRRRKALVRG
jgi:subtilisin-like proprotein convertase family protein